MARKLRRAKVQMFADPLTVEHLDVICARYDLSRSVALRTAVIRWYNQEFANRQVVEVVKPVEVAPPRKANGGKPSRIKEA